MEDVRIPPPPTALRNNAIDAVDQLEFDPPQSLLNNIASLTSSSAAVNCLKELVMQPLQCGIHSRNLLKTLQVTQKEISLEEEQAFFVLCCSFYSAKTTRKTLLQCLALFPPSLLGKVLGHYLTKVVLFCSRNLPQPMGLKEVAGISALVDSKPQHLRCVVAAVVVPWMVVLHQHLKELVSQEGFSFQAEILVKVN